MIKVLNLGSAGIKDLEAQADKLGSDSNMAKNIGQIDAYIKAQKDNERCKPIQLKMSCRFWLPYGAIDRFSIKA
jgi:hypothetical protein